MDCKLERVTITGADDRSDIKKLLEISEEHPFVEWGILVSLRSEGMPRFPGREWIDEFVAACRESNKPIDVSMHVCGKWVRQLLVGELEWSDLPSVCDIAQRVQINTHAELHTSSVGIWKSLKQQSEKERGYVLHTSIARILPMSNWRVLQWIRFRETGLAVEGCIFTACETIACCGLVAFCG